MQTDTRPSPLSRRQPDRHLMPVVQPPAEPSAPQVERGSKLS